jgi:2'-5' RNA ligase
MDLSQIMSREIWNLNENVQQMDKFFVKTGLFDNNDRDRVISITNGDNFTYFISKMYAWIFQIGEYNRGDNYNPEQKESKWNSYHRNYLNDIYQQVKNYNSNVFPIENFNSSDGGSLHPIEIAETFKGRELALKILAQIPNIYLRNLKNDIRRVRTIDDMKYGLPTIMKEINNHFKLYDRLSEEKRNIVFKKIFSSKNDTFEKILTQLKNSNNYLYHEDAIDELLDKINYEAEYGEADLLYDNNNVVVVDVKSSDAMKNLGCGSQWCFATEHGIDHWINYADNSHVNIVYNFNLEPDDENRMVVVLPEGSIYNMYNQYMDGDENMGGMEGNYYLDSIGVADRVNLNLTPKEINDSYNPKAFTLAEDKSVEGLAKKMNAGVIYDKNNDPYFVRELGGHKDYLGVFVYDRGRFKQIGGVNYHIKDGKVIPLGVSIDDKYQKRGVGTAFYKYIKDKLRMNLQPSHNQTKAGKNLWQRVNEIDDYMMNMYSNDDLEHVNDPNDKSDGGYGGPALSVDSESRGYNELGDKFDEGLKDNLITHQKIDLPIGNLFSFGKMNEYEEYKNLSNNNIKRVIKYIENIDKYLNKPDLGKNISLLYRLYLINIQNIDRILKLVNDPPSYYNNLMKLQETLKKFSGPHGIVSEDLEYNHVDDATKDKFMIGGGSVKYGKEKPLPYRQALQTSENVNEDGTSLYTTVRGTQNPDDIAPWLYEEESIVTYNELDDIVKGLNAECFAIISAFVKGKSNNYNSKATKLLFDRVLKPLSTKIIKLTGQWDVNVYETSFFVLKPENMDCNNFMGLIERTALIFGQESYLWSDNGDIILNYTDGSEDDIGDDLKITNSYVGFKFEGADEDLVEMGLVNEDEERLIQEESVSRLLNHIQNGDFAIMSANRNELSNKENIQQSKALSNDLQKEKAGHINLIGHWQELHRDTRQEIPVKETSFFIPKPEALDFEKFKEFIIGLGDKYLQESVIIGKDGIAYELFANGGNRKLGKLTMQNIGKAYSTMRKKPNVDFTFEGFGERRRRLSKQGTIKEERIKTWMPKMSEPQIKKSCRLGGKLDGTSDACSQGDTGAVSYKKIQDGQSHKPNEPNVAEDQEKWFEKGLSESSLNEVGEANVKPYDLKATRVQKDGMLFEFVTDTNIEYIIQVNFHILPRLYFIEDESMSDNDKSFFYSQMPQNIVNMSVLYTTKEHYEKLNSREASGKLFGKKGREDYYPTLNTGEPLKIFSTLNLAVNSAYKKALEYYGTVNMVSYLPKVDVKGDERRKRINQIFIEKALERNRIPVKKKLVLHGTVYYIISDKEPNNVTQQPNESYINESLLTEEKVEYGALMAYLKIKNWSGLIQKIDDNELYDDGSGTFGREEEQHITILYGFYKQVNGDDFKEILDKYKEPIEAELTGISLFENEDFDVVKIDVKPSKELLAIRKEVEDFPATIRYKEFHPHMTLAYVKKGEGKKYVQKFKKPIKIKTSNIIYSTKDRKKTKFSLNENIENINVTKDNKFTYKKEYNLNEIRKFKILMNL